MPFAEDFEKENQSKSEKKSHKMRKRKVITTSDDDNGNDTDIIENEKVEKKKSKAKKRKQDEMKTSKSPITNDEPKELEKKQDGDQKVDVPSKVLKKRGRKPKSDKNQSETENRKKSSTDDKKKTKKEKKSKKDEKNNEDDYEDIRSKLTEEELEHLRDLEVRLIHDVPEQHTIESAAGTRSASKREREMFQEIAELRVGLYYPNEDELIMENWREFCELHNWDDTKFFPFLHFYEGGYIIRNNVARRKFVQFLARGLDNRLLHSVYFRFKTLVSEHKRERYSKEEDMYIIHEVSTLDKNNKGPYLSKLAKHLNRTRSSIWRRCQVLENWGKLKFAKE